ncbi:hypothetical protein BpHYR1_054169 [Brachionus plicatilis]|uniref:Uncharacterized protein n=1 Tax=Brachionus plicatilis TaxID=10195 RepID=A0A3M7S1G0_BRAPC|nr:hypothetical protein BpHYR1_054169 [Brachionus plicatilis]
MIQVTISTKSADVKRRRKLPIKVLLKVLKKLYSLSFISIWYNRTRQIFIKKFSQNSKMFDLESESDGSSQLLDKDIDQKERRKDSQKVTKKSIVYKKDKPRLLNRDLATRDNFGDFYF